MFALTENCARKNTIAKGEERKKEKLRQWEAKTERKKERKGDERKEEDRKKERKITTVRAEERKESVFPSLENILQDSFIKWFTLKLKGKLTTKFNFFENVPC